MTALSPHELVIAKLDALGLSVKQTGQDQLEAQCPAHDDRVASLSIGTGNDGKALLHCKAGCSLADVCASLSIEERDLFLADGRPRTDRVLPAVPKRGSAPPVRLAVAQGDVERYHQALLARPAVVQRLAELRGWTVPAIERLKVGIVGDRLSIPVHNAGGQLVDVLRYRPNPETRNGDKKMLATPGAKRDLFPAPETIDVGELTFLVEGESDAISLWSAGVPAVAVPGVAARDAAWPERFAGRSIVVCMDADAPGRSASAWWADALLPVAAEVRLLDIAPKRDDGYDVGDLVREAGPVQARAVLERTAAALPPLERSPVPAPASSPPAAPAKPDRIMFANASTVRTERIRWLIRGLVPLRGLTVVGGEKALGKSLLTGAIWAADVTRGQTDGEYQGAPRGVLLLSAEDDWPTVIVPRLMAAGANLERVYRPTLGSGDAMIEFPRSVPALETQITAHAEAGSPIALVVVDPIGAFLGGDIDSHRDASVRHALAPLAEMAMRTDTAVVIVAHLNKAEGSRIVNRFVGSVAFVNAARSIVAFSRDPEDPDGERGTRRVVVPTSNNWSALAKALSANVESRTVPLHDESEASVGYLNVTGESTVVVEDLQRGPGNGADSDDVEAAIMAVLANGQAQTPREVKGTVANELGCSWKTVARAAERLEVNGQLAREHPDQPSLTRWRAWDTHPSPNVSKDQNRPETLDESLFGHMDTQDRVQRDGDDPDAELDRIVAKFPDHDLGVAQTDDPAGDASG